MIHNKYSGIVAVTNRSICQKSYDANNIPYSIPTEPLLNQIRLLCHTDIEFIILREKDLTVMEYTALAMSALDICNRYNKKLVLHSYTHTADTLEHRHIHLPLYLLESISNNDSMCKLSLYKTIGASVHSPDEAVQAEALGATYLTAGHIFDTECKKGIPGQGLSFLRDVCSAVQIPVYAIGGITEDNLPYVIKEGAKGGCMMSGVMQCMPFMV